MAQTDSESPIHYSLAEKVEAILMVADQPQSLLSIATALEVPLTEIKSVISHLSSDYKGELNGPKRGFELREVAGGWRVYAREEHDDSIRKLVEERSAAKLSQAALETLAVVAYKQPVTRGHLSAIRAVNVDSVVRTLVARGLITESHTDPETGAVFYETTPMFLEQLGIESLDQLPPLSPLLDDGTQGFEDVD